MLDFDFDRNRRCTDDFRLNGSEWWYCFSKPTVLLLCIVRKTVFDPTYFFVRFFRSFDKQFEIKKVCVYKIEFRFWPLDEIITICHSRRIVRTTYCKRYKCSYKKISPCTDEGSLTFYPTSWRNFVALSSTKIVSVECRPLSRSACTVQRNRVSVQSSSSLSGRDLHLPAPCSVWIHGFVGGGRECI